jgi:hypothetical protein
MGDQLRTKQGRRTEFVETIAKAGICTRSHADFDSQRFLRTTPVHSGASLKLIVEPRLYMLLRFQKAAGRGNYETGNQAFSKRLRFLTIRPCNRVPKIVPELFWGTRRTAGDPHPKTDYIMDGEAQHYCRTYNDYAYKRSPHVVRLVTSTVSSGVGALGASRATNQQKTRLLRLVSLWEASPN